MIDVVLGAGVFEGVRPDGLSGVEGGLDVGGCRARVAWRGEVDSGVGEDGVDLVGDGLDQVAQEVRAVRRVAFSCSSTKANFEVRSIAPMR